ncbi:MAG: ribonuclease R [Planctomycetia bacterium]|nr:ribonuclease R [Planctomycetia bacterium]
MSESEMNETEGREDAVSAGAPDTTAKPPTETLTLSERVLAHLNAPNYRPVKPRVIAKQLKVSEDERHEVRRVIKKLVKRGLAVFGAQHLVGPIHAPPLKTTKKQNKLSAEIAAKTVGDNTANAPFAKPQAKPVAASGDDELLADDIDDELDMTPEVESDEATEEVQSRERPLHRTKLPGKSKSGLVGTFRRHQAGFGFVRPLNTQGNDRAGDIFVLADDASDAATGDTVRVKVSSEKHRNRNAQGRIIEIMERKTHQFVGTYLETGGGAFVQVDGTIFKQPISVGDPGAKNARPDDKVVFEMVRVPTYWQSGDGVIVEVLGARGEPGIDTLSVIREFDLPEAFPDDVVEDARRQADAFDETNLGDRMDLTGKTVITIDPVDARDFDDAISLEKLENGHWLLGVHIADVAHFVRPKSPLDREARERGTSVYLPDRVIPMIPEVISNGLASLQPDRVRYVKTAFMEITPEGIRCNVELRNAAIKSCRRFSYEEVDDYLADRTAWNSKLTPEVHELLARMHELGMLLRQRRMAKGALELSMSEVKIDLDKNGKVVGAHRVVNTESHQLIEEFMLAANMAVAETIEEAGWHFLRRIHEAPDPRKLKLLEGFVNSLGLTAEGLESRFALQQLLADAHGQPTEQAVNYALLRSLQRAVYAPNEEGHYALASDCYCHFTSPIRRYPDLTIHRLFDCLVNGHKPRNDFDELASLGEHCSDRERRAESAERELTKVKLLTYLSDKIGEEMEAVVTGVEEFGLFAQGREIPAEGMIHASTLADDIYHYDRPTHSLTGRRAGNAFRLGDRIRVTIAHIDVDRRELDFRIVDRLGRAKVAKHGEGVVGKHGLEKNRFEKGAERKNSIRPASKESKRRKR